LIRTHHSEASRSGGYAPHPCLLTPAAAALLLAGGLQLLGTDRLSVDDSAGSDFALHRMLLGAGCVILEGLLLTDVRPGRYQLVAAPLRLSGAEASPVRALLLK
jgi:arylformamidase